MLSKNWCGKASLNPRRRDDPMIEREPGDRVEGRVTVAFHRRRSRERLMPMTKTHRCIMAKLYEATCIIEIPFRLRET